MYRTASFFFAISTVILPAATQSPSTIASSAELVQVRTEAQAMGRGHDTPEAAAKAAVQAVAGRDYELFLRTRALFECEEASRGGPNRYAETLHRTEFTKRDGGSTSTVYDLTNRLDVDSAAAISKHRLDLEFVDAAMFADKIPHQQHFVIDVTINDHRGREYVTRTAVIEHNQKWFAVPRCFPSQRVYELVDSASTINTTP